MPPAARFTVKPFTNPRSQTTSYRVEGVDLDGTRIRTNRATEEEALALAADYEAKAARAQNARQPRLVQTRLTDAELLVAESTVLGLAPGRSFESLIEAGKRALEHSPAPQPVAALGVEWLRVMKSQVSARWYTDLDHRLGLFLAAHPGLSSDQFTRALVRRWIDGMKHAAQTKSNYRGAVRRFGSWLVERGILKENPAAELRISKAVQINETPPTVLTPDQAAAIEALIEGPVRPLLGWMALSLDAGLRPEMEAVNVVWPEVNFERAVVLASGKKRGLRLREVPLSARALRWLRIAKAAGDERPAFYHRYWRTVLVRAVNKWLAEHRPGAAPLVWDEDILRHTYASCQAALGMPIGQLADLMGNSKETIQKHYRHPIGAAAARSILGLDTQL